MYGAVGTINIPGDLIDRTHSRGAAERHADELTRLWRSWGFRTPEFWVMRYGPEFPRQDNGGPGIWGVKCNLVNGLPPPEAAA